MRLLPLPPLPSTALLTREAIRAAMAGLSACCPPVPWGGVARPPAARTSGGGLPCAAASTTAAPLPRGATRGAPPGAGNRLGHLTRPLTASGASPFLRSPLGERLPRTGASGALSGGGGAGWARRASAAAACAHDAHGADGAHGAHEAAAGSSGEVRPWPVRQGGALLCR